MIEPNSRDTAATTAGVSRNMQLGIDAFVASVLGVVPLAAGGGDLNGSAALVYFGQSGTNGSRWQRPRSRGTSGGNYCGTV
jgi:hypothetical protein